MDLTLTIESNLLDVNNKTLPLQIGLMSMFYKSNKNEHMAHFANRASYNKYAGLTLNFFIIYSAAPLRLPNSKKNIRKPITCISQYARRLLYLVNKMS